VSKTFKYISVIFLWIAGLTLSAHLIIPHDHHTADSFIDQDENCPASNQRPDHNSGFPVHCHAFNDLTSEKTRPLQISDNVQFSFVTYSILTDKSSVIFQSSLFSLKEYSETYFDSYILKFSSLRAPPASA
jgi:hypothetical protein